MTDSNSHITALLISFGPVLIVNLIILISLFYYTVSGQNKISGNAEGAKRYRSKFLSSFLKSWWLWNVEPIARFFVRLHIGPNMLTFIGFLFSVVAGLLFAKGYFGYAGWMIIFGATFDIFDGYVARLTGKSSRSGAYFDSVMDRFGEGVSFIGLAYFFRDSWVFYFVVIALLGSMMVSYTRARGEGVGVVCKKGSMQRPERIVYMGVSSVLTPVATLIFASFWKNPQPILVMIAMVIMALGTFGTSIYRMIYIMNTLDVEDQKEDTSLPQIITQLSTQEGREEFWSKAKFGYDRGRSKYKHVVTLLVDGLSSELFRELIKKGELPNISRYLIENGSMSKGIAAYPALSGLSSAPVVTGCFPGTCNIPATKWFNRFIPEERVISMNRFRDYSKWEGNYAMDHDLSKEVQTIFEYSKKATNIFGRLNRGCGLIRDPGSFRWHHMHNKASDERDMSLIDETGKRWFKAALLRDSDYILFSFPSIEIELNSGSEKAAVVKRYSELDKLVGWINKETLDGLKSKEVALSLVGGYGISRAKSAFDINDFINKRFSTFCYPGKLRGWVDSQAIITISGTSLCHLYMKSKNGWEGMSYIEEIQRTGLVGALLEQNGIDFIAGRSADGGILAINRRGSAHIIEDRDGRITSIEKGDPFDFANALPQVYSEKELLQKTWNKKYPLASLQLLQLFRSSRCGDLVIIASKDCDLNAASETPSLYSSGSLEREHIEVPVISNFELPDVMETSTLFKTNLNMLGIEARHKVDGSNIKAVYGENQSLVTGR